ncbi:hypothetical protein ACFVW9_20115 [Streptomyces sp. NPDC058217]|uniref:hypothetical protein n=1 Tax=Streptomyces sp. NPDC058217 TaxID=3346384 RepID=UPI0036E0B78F
MPDPGRPYRPNDDRIVDLADPDHSRAGDPTRAKEAPFAQVSAVLPLYHQQTKNLLVSYSPKKLGLFGTNEDRRLARTSVVPATQGWWRAAGLQESLRVRRWLFLKSTTARCE